MKQRVILFPITDSLRNGYRGLVKQSDTNFTDAHSGQWLQGGIRLSLRFLVAVLYVLLVLPLILGLLFPTAILIWWIRGKKAGNKVFDSGMNWFERGKRIVPFQLEAFPWEKTGYRPEQVREDIPAFLAGCRKQRFRIVGVMPSGQMKEWGNVVEKLKRTGRIDDWFAYGDDVELTNYLIRDDVYEKFSWIIQPYEEARYGMFRHDRLLWITANRAVANRYTIFSSFHETLPRIMFSRIMLPYNRLLDESVVLYFETEHHPAVNAYLRNYYRRVQQALEDKGLRLLYFPALQRRADLQLDLERLWEYSYADLFENEEKVTSEKLFEWVDAIDLGQVYRLLRVYFGIPDGPSPAFIHCVQRLEECDPEKPVSYSYTPLFGDNESSVGEEIDYYIQLVKYPSSQVMYSLARREEEDYDADKFFSADGSEIAPEVKVMIASIKTKVGEERILETLFHIIHAFRDREPEVCKKLCHQLYEASPGITRKVSRIRIDRQYRIFLSDYSDLEVEMTPLPKTLFLFMLKYPNGVLFKELYRHKQELLYIYGKISRRSDFEVMQKSIHDMTDARSNSINEKCSRIKEAFVSRIDERIAREYFITGNRQEPKRLRIDRSLVRFEEDL